MLLSLGLAGANAAAIPAIAATRPSLPSIQIGCAGSGKASVSTRGGGYDSAFHLTSSNNSGAGTSSTYTPDNAGQLTGLTTTKSGATTQQLTLGYNGNGDRTSQSDSISGSSRSYSYDQADRLTSVVSGTTTLGSYSYDGNGLRASKTVGGTTSSFYYDQSGAVPELIAAGSSMNSTSYIDGPGGQPVEQVDGAGNIRYVLPDQHGSTRGLVDPTGTVRDTYSYDAYGRPTAYIGSVADTALGYAGQYTDSETGLQYLQARYYDPGTQQFLSRDPLAALTRQPYAYANDDPLTYTDPSGLCTQIGFVCVPDKKDLGDAAGATGTRLGGTLGAAGTATGTAASQAQLAVYRQIDRLNHSALSTAVFAAITPGCVPGYQRCQLKTPSEAGQVVYGWAVGTTGFADSFSFGAASGGLGLLGIPVPACAQTYQTGSQLGGLANAAVAVASLGADPTADAAIGAEIAPSANRVLVDSNAVVGLGRNATLDGRLGANEQAVVSYVTRPELRNAVARGQGLRGVPRILDTVPVVTNRPSLDTVINIRGTLLRTSGRFGDGIIGAQAVEFGLPLITNDAELSRAVRAFGGTVR